VPFAANFDHHVFISYAGDDDLTEPSVKVGWVSTFVEGLRTALRRAGARDAVIWFDKKDHPRTGQISENLRAAVHGSATLVVFLSSAYLGSGWCHQERNAFVHRHGIERIFVVRLDASEAPRELEEVRGYEFFRRESGSNAVRTLGRPEPNPQDELDRPYYAGMDDVARDIARCLEKMVDVAPLASEPAVEVGTPAAVLLAEVPEALTTLRDEVRRYLEQVGIAVLPSVRYPRSPEKYRSKLEADLRQSRLFVQLLSDAPEPQTSELRGDYVGLQLDSATAVEILQWRRPDLNLASVADEGYRRVLDGPKVQAVDIEEFKQTIVARWKRAGAHAAEPTPIRLVFINADNGDRMLAQRISESYASKGYAAVLSQQSGPPDKVREDFERFVHSSDAVLVLYETCTKFWVREQVRQLSRVMYQLRPPPILAIYEGPPPPSKEPLDVRWPGLRYLRNAEELSSLFDDGPP
jgi:hypothetical protein